MNPNVSEIVAVYQRCFSTEVNVDRAKRFHPRHLPRRHRTSSRGKTPTRRRFVRAICVFWRVSGSSGPDVSIPRGASSCLFCFWLSLDTRRYTAAVVTLNPRTRTAERIVTNANNISCALLFLLFFFSSFCRQRAREQRIITIEKLNDTYSRSFSVARRVEHMQMRIVAFTIIFKRIFQFAILSVMKYFLISHSGEIKISGYVFVVTKVYYDYLFCKIYPRLSFLFE